MIAEATDTEAPPTVQEVEKEGEALRAKLNVNPDAIYESAPEQPAPAAPPEAPEPPQPPETPEAQPSQKTRDEKGRFAKQEQQQPPAQPQDVAAPVEPTKEESKYAKAKKDAERKDRSWRKLEEDKADFQRRQADFQSQQQQFAQYARQQQAQASQQRQQQSDVGRFSPEEFERAADWYDAEAKKAVEAGDLDKFNELSKNADLTRKAAKQSQTQLAQQHQQQSVAAFSQAYEASAARVFEKEPDLANPESEAGKKLVELLREQPILQMIPDGFEKAYELLQLRDKASGYDSAIARAEKAEKEVERLTKLTQPGAGGPAAPVTAAPDADNMPLDQLERQLRERANSGQALMR